MKKLISECCGAEVKMAMRRIGSMEHICGKCGKHCDVIEATGEPEKYEAVKSKKGLIFGEDNGNGDSGIKTFEEAEPENYSDFDKFDEQKDEILNKENHE